MAGYLFDTMVHVVACDTIPEKWRRPWKEVKEGTRPLILFEPLIAEIFYKLCEKKREKDASDRIWWLKGLPTTKIVDMDDNTALEAGRLHRRFNDLSIIDAFSLAIAKKERAKIFTTDTPIRNAGKVSGIDIDWLPVEELELESK